jgi:hypothetical protein
MTWWEYMLNIIFEGLLTDSTEEMIWARLWLLNNGRVFFLRSFLSVEVFQIFYMLVLKVVVVLLSVLSFVSQRKQRCSQRCKLIKVGKIILSDIELILKESFKLLLSSWQIYQKIVILLSIHFVLWLHPTWRLMCCEHSMTSTWYTENCLLCLS